MGEGECMQIVANYLRFGHFWRWVPERRL